MTTFNSSIQYTNVEDEQPQGTPHYSSIVRHECETLMREFWSSRRLRNHTEISQNHIAFQVQECMTGTTVKQVKIDSSNQLVMAGGIIDRIVQSIINHKHNIKVQYANEFDISDNITITADIYHNLITIDFECRGMMLSKLNEALGFSIVDSAPFSPDIRLLKSTIIAVSVNKTLGDVLA